MTTRPNTPAPAARGYRFFTPAEDGTLRRMVAPALWRMTDDYLLAL